MRPEWIYDSIRAWMRLDEKSYRITPKKPSKPYNRKRRLEETVEEGEEVVADIIAPPILFDENELEEINKELAELEDDEEEVDDDESVDNFNSSKSDSASEYDEYPGTGSDTGSFEDLEQSLF